MGKSTTSVLFVCLGNICRSTMAEAVLRHLSAEAGLSDRIHVDSAGTGSWHTGEPPHSGTRKKLEENDVSWQGIHARQITRQDFIEFDHIVCMDQNNLRDLGKYGANKHPSCRLLSSYLPGADWSEVPDPWYTGNFEETYQLVGAACAALLEQLKRELRL